MTQKNNEKYIKKCLDSIIRIKAFENRVIIIDNGSKDETCDILKKYEIIMEIVQ